MRKKNEKAIHSSSQQTQIVFDELVIQSPKRTAQAQQGWDGFFPYYAGYPESFSRALLKSADLPASAMVLDPWNGSGTTTFSAAHLGLAARGFDLNPIMVIVARARLLPPSEADSIEPLAREMLKGIRAKDCLLIDDDPLLGWYNRPTAALLRAVERRIRDHLIGERTITVEGTKLQNISGLAATFYVALFSVCRQLTERFHSSNPTWLRKPTHGEKRITSGRDKILDALKTNLKSMAAALAERRGEQAELGTVALKVADSTKEIVPASSIDLVLTSPPYCTRIDYSAATRIELALMYPLLKVRMEELGRRMIGSTRVPDRDIAVQPAWGKTCAQFLDEVEAHPSKASAGYYLKTHLDYFDKMARSLAKVAAALKPRGVAILVVQDSFYKDVHNDLPSITAEMADHAGLRLCRRDDFHLSRSMAGINPHTRTYQRRTGALEAVLCFAKT